MKRSYWEHEVITVFVGVVCGICTALIITLALLGSLGIWDPAPWTITGLVAACLLAISIA